MSMRLSYAILPALALVLIGCGGVFTNSSGDGSGGSGGGGTTDSLEDKIKATTALDAYMNSLDQTNHAVFLGKVAEKMPSLGFKNVRLGTDRIEANFSDGRPYLIDDYREPAPKGARPQLPIRSLAHELPKGKTAISTTCLGTAFTNVASVLRTWTPLAGYTAGRGDSSVSGYILTFKNDLMYVDAHGAVMNGQYALWTSDKAEWPIKDPTFNTLYKGWYIELVNASFDRDNNGNLVYETRYAITTKYILEYVNFKPGSILMNNSCYGDANAAWKAALKQKGLSTYMGWTNPALDDFSADSAFFIYDKCLSTGVGAIKDDPLQRPFDLDTVYGDLVKRKMATDGKGSTLMLRHLKDTVSLFRPTIQNLVVKGYERELQISGDFGSDQGTVTINGVPATITSWSSNLIKVTLPDSGAGAYGDVIVEVRGLKSTPVQLSHWEGDVFYEDKHTALLDTVDIKVRFHVSLRADVHSYRTAISTTPVEGVVTSTCDRSSSCSWTCSGTQGTTVTWSGSGSPAQSPPGPNSASSMFQVAYSFDVKTKKLRLGLIAIDRQSITVSNPVHKLDLPFAMQVFDEKPGPFNLPTIDVFLGPDFSIPAGNRSYSAGAGASAYSLQWNAMPTAFPPTDQATHRPGW